MKEIEKIISRRLKGLMAEHDITVCELSKRIGVPEKSLILKINGQRDWWFWENILIIKEFGLPEIKDVFPELYNHALNIKQN